MPILLCIKIGVDQDTDENTLINIVWCFKKNLPKINHSVAESYIF